MGRVVLHHDALCVAATALRPEDRLASARELHDRLDRVLAGERGGERRRELALGHIAAAQGARARSDGPGPDALAARRQAIHELGRALALDPGNDAAVHALLDLLADLPRVVPPEIERALARSRQATWRGVAHMAGLAYASTFLYAPFFAWAGVRRLEPLLVFYMLLALAAALALWVSRQEPPSRGLIAVVLVASTLGFAGLAGLFGPLIAAPTLIAVNAGAFALLSRHRARPWLILGGALAILGPLALELLGHLPPTYAFVGGDMVVRSRVLDLAPLPTRAILALISITTLIAAVVLFGELRARLERVEERLHLYSWQLRQLVPPARRRRATE